MCKLLQRCKCIITLLIVKVCRIMILQEKVDAFLVFHSGGTHEVKPIPVVYPSVEVALVVGINKKIHYI